MKIPALALAVALAASSCLAQTRTLLIDDFEKGVSPVWKEREFKGRTVYEAVEDPTGSVLRATSKNAASGLMYEIDFDPAECPVLTWRWKIDRTISASDPAGKATDDYPARVYVVFPSWFMPATRTINYIWATNFPKEAFTPNPFLSRAMMLAVESGGENAGRWVAERRNIVEDFRRLFGGDPPRAGAIALMTDTDNTGESAVAYYDDIRLECSPKQ